MWPPDVKSRLTGKAPDAERLKALLADSLPSEPPEKLHEKPRQHIKKQRHHFADKDLYSQSYGFSSSSHTVMRVGP